MRNKFKEFVNSNSLTFLDEQHTKMKRKIIFITGILAFLVLTTLSVAENQKFSAKVIAIEKGDVIKVLHKETTLTIILYGIECLETSQPYGQKAQRFTSQAVLDQSIIIEIQNQQNDTQYIGNVILPDGTVLNQSIVKKGLATWDRKNAPDDIILQSLQSIAKEMGVGMWAHAVEPDIDQTQDTPLLTRDTSEHEKANTATRKTLTLSPLFIIISKISIPIVIFAALIFLALKYKKKQRKKSPQKLTSNPFPKSDPISIWKAGEKESPPDFKQAEEAIESNKQAIQDLLNNLSDFVFTLVENNSTYDDKIKNHKISIKNAMTRAGVEETRRLLLSEIDQIQINSNTYRTQLEQANNTIVEQKTIMEKIQIDAKLDSLTKLANRGAFDESLKKEFERTKRYGSTLSLAMIDIDFFKKVNDRYGHIAGDKTLQAIAKLLREQTRVNDFVSRFGGEEFAVLLPQTSADKTQSVMEKIRKNVQASHIMYDGSKIKVTISIGVGEIDLPSETMESLIKKVDAALYRAKESGRNRVVVETKKQPAIDPYH